MSHLVTEVYDAFRAAGVDDSTAKAAAGAIPLTHEVATRGDVERIRRELLGDIERVRADMGEFRMATRVDIERVRADMGEFKADIYRALYRGLWLQGLGIVTLTVALLRILP